MVVSRVNPSFLEGDRGEVGELYGECGRVKGRVLLFFSSRKNASFTIGLVERIGGDPQK